MNKCIRYGLAVAPLILWAACVSHESSFVSHEGWKTGVLTNETIAWNSSAPSLDFVRAEVLTNNDDAFRRKLDLVRGATRSIDLAYFIFADDYSSSLLSQALIDAARRGVRVRMLLDYQTNYKDLDRLSMLEREGNAGAGSLEVRLYNRPTENVVKDAVFLTMGCGPESEADKSGCDNQKYSTIDALFRDEPVAGNVSNLNSGYSGLFLSGLYGKDAKAMTVALTEGQHVDAASFQQASASKPDPTKLEQLKRLGRIYWQSRFAAGPQRLFANLQLLLAFQLYGEEINPLYDAITGYFPLERADKKSDADRDWRFLTDYLHHKLLLVDESRFQLGGRNVEDSYHMNPNPLNEKYVFMDTDVQVDLRSGGEAMTRAFEQLWNFRAMVAGLDEVRRHAPNDFIAAHAIAARETQNIDRNDPSYGPTYESIVDRYQYDLAARMDIHRDEMVAHAAEYGSAYAPVVPPNAWPRFEIDASASLHYFENLPFLREAPKEAVLGRSYGSVNEFEGEHGKHIHTLWIQALRDTVVHASAEHPQEIFLHNAYFALPSNLMSEFGSMIDGTLDCRHVTIRVLTNSIETTDLNIVNLVSNHVHKAFADFYREHRHPERGATVEYYEYRPVQGIGTNLSLHTKAEIFGSNMFIGSANADVRSYIQDSNNGLFIQNAPRFVETYRAWLGGLLHDPTRVRSMVDLYTQKTPAELRAMDLENLRAIMAKYRAERWIDDPKPIEARFEKMLIDAYDLTTQILQGGKKGRAAESKYNALFMAL